MTVILEALAALALTIAFELAVVWLMHARTRRELLAVVAVNAITNPLLSLLAIAGQLAVLPLLPATLRTPVSAAFVVVAEATIVLVEWRLLAWSLRADSRTWLVRSLAMNAVSFLVGTPLLWFVWPLVVR